MLPLRNHTDIVVVLGFFDPLERKDRSLRVLAFAFAFQGSLFIVKPFSCTCIMYKLKINDNML